MNFGTKLCLWSVPSSQYWSLCLLSMFHSLVSSLRNPLITSRRSISSQPLASASIIRFYKKDMGSSSTFSEKDLGVVMGFPLFDWPFIIHSATILSLFSACSCILSPSGTLIFQWDLGCHGLLGFRSSSLLLSSSPPPPLAGGIFF